MPGVQNSEPVGQPSRCTAAARSAPLDLVASLLAACSGAAAPEPYFHPRPRPLRARSIASSPRLVDPSGFAALVARDEVFVLNVHVPDEGSIPGTDSLVPSATSRRARELPPDKSSPVAVYCRTGRMSATAVATLAGLGYTSLSGMIAWAADGRPLLPPAS